MSKKDPVLVALGECPEKWNPFLLKTYGLPQDPSTRKEVQQDCLPRDNKGRRFTLDEIGESATLDTNDDGVGLPESTPSPVWLRSRELLRVIFTILICERRGGTYTAKVRDELDDIPSRTELPRFPDSFGSAEDLLRRWQDHEIGIRLEYNGRQPTIILMEETLPPDEPEDLDEAGEPSGHWDGLKWTPGTGK